MSHIAQERFHKGESSLISIDFLDGFHVAKLQQRLPASFDGREAGSKVLGRLHGDVLFEFGPQEFLVPRGRRPRGQRGGRTASESSFPFAFEASATELT